VRTATLLAVVVALLGAAAASGAGTSEPLALLRAPRANDTLPARFRPQGVGLLETRLVAAAPRKGSARLYLVQTSAGDLCELLVYKQHAAGSGCRPLEGFFAPGSAITALSGRFFAGVAANDVERVVLIDRNGLRHPVALTPDHGFIFACTGPEGCACKVAWADAYNAAGERVSHNRWLAPRCWRLPK
jgi:hypothetical protein